MSRTDYRERDIGKLRKTAITIWLFSGFFGIIILMSSTPVGLSLGCFFLFVSFIVVVIWGMWRIATKADELVGRLGVEIEEPESSHQISPRVVEENNESNTADQPMSNGKVLVIGISLAVILYWVTNVT